MGGVEGELLYTKEWEEEDNNSCSGCGGKEGVAHRLAILPFIPGQKYTIGTFVSSREEQGEFIFCFFDGVCKNTEGHCSISCCSGDGGSGSGFTVAVVESEHSKVFLNGDEVMRGSPRNLEFGDEIKLQDDKVSKTLVLYFKRPLYGLPVDKKVFHDQDRGDRVVYYEEPQHLCLSCRDHVVEERRSCVLVEKTTTPTALQLGLVIQKVLTFLPFDDLKEARLVAKVWAEEGAILLKKRAKVSFDLRRVWSFRVFDNGPTTTKPLTLYLHQMKGFGLSSVRFEIQDKVYSDAIMNKFTEDMETFLDEGVWHVDHPLTHVEVQLHPNHPQDFETFKRILEATSPNLKTLKVSIFTEFVHLPNPKMFENSFKSFPNLQKLSFRFHNFPGSIHATPEGQEIWNAFVENFLKIPTPRLNCFAMDVTDSNVVEDLCFRTLLNDNVTCLEVVGGVPMWWVESKKSNTLEKVKIIPKSGLMELLGGNDE